MIFNSIYDFINSAFELFAGFFILGNCRVLYKDKMVRGVSIIAVSFFTLWGVWNVFYYPIIDQWFSFIAGLFVLSANTLWVGMMIYYSNKETGRLFWRKK